MEATVAGTLRLKAIVAGTQGLKAFVAGTQRPSENIRDELELAKAMYGQR